MNRLQNRRCRQPRGIHLLLGATALALALSAASAKTASPTSDHCIGLGACC